MKLAMVSGSYPPDVCGSGDYTQRLAEALEVRGVSVEVITGTDWGVKNVPRVQRLIRTLRADLTHIQYPTVGYGRKLGPQLIGLFERAVVTPHEASQTHILRRLSLFPFLFGRRIIFTNRFEQAYVSRMAPRLTGATGRQCVCRAGPIGLPSRHVAGQLAAHGAGSPLQH